MENLVRILLLAVVLLMIFPLVGMAGTTGTSAQSQKTVRLTKATFAGGCFWCMQPAFDKLSGVISTTVGYTGGRKINPSYAEVSAGSTGHAESIQIIFDPAKISYAKLLDVFWHNIDPTTPDRQFCDIGHQYRTAIFYHDETQKKEAEESRLKLEKTRPFKGPVVTEISRAADFYPAEEYHQKYYLKNPIRYKLYRYNCGRDQRLRQVWGSAPAH